MAKYSQIYVLLFFHRQFFSAAFNLFTPIKVDSKTTVTDKLEIARLAIQIAKEGGFEKVTWDGAEDGKVPSDPITETLGMYTFLTSKQLSR